MNVALLFENGQLCHLDKNLGAKRIKVIVYAVDQGQYVRSLNDYLFHQSIVYLSLWIISKQIKVLFVADIDTDIKNLLLKLGTLVKVKEELENDPFFYNLDLSLLTD